MILYNMEPLLVLAGGVAAKRTSKFMQVPQPLGEGQGLGDGGDITAAVHTVEVA
jgi:hypothetical protein